MTRRVLILGGAGAIGTRIARLISQQRDIELLIAGRDFGRATQFADELSEGGVSVRPIGMDDVPGSMARERPALLIDAAGPSRGRSLAVPRACIAARVPYIDIASDYAFSNDVRTLNQSAQMAGVPILTGAGITPCVTFAAAEAIAASMSAVESVRIAICPGNQHPFGSASYAGFLAQAGQPFRWRENGAWRTVFGWQETRWLTLPEIGKRRMGALDTPDLTLLMERWPALRDVSVHAGVEIRPLQRAMSTLAWMSRMGLRLPRFGGMLEASARTLGHLGTHRFVLQVSLGGRGGSDRVERSWTLIAEDGGHVAAAPAVILCRRILQGAALQPGARMAALTVSDIRTELMTSGCEIRMNETSL